MTEPTDAELDAVLCNQWPAFSMQATLVRVWVRAAMRDAVAKWGTPPAPAAATHIQQPYTLAEIKAKIASNDYSAELMLQHAMLLLEKPAAVAGPSRDLHPEKCPITGRPFFMVLDHPELGPVPTYGGPFDSYTIPAPEGEPTDPWHERELRCERFDHDAGYWVEGGEPIPLRIVHDDVLDQLQSDAAAPTTQAAPMESVLIDGVAYQTPAPVAAELLRLHIDALQAAPQPASQQMQVAVLPKRARIPQDFRPLSAANTQFHAGKLFGSGKAVWCTDSDGKFWCGNWHHRTPRELESECLSTLRDLWELAGIAPQPAVQQGPVTYIAHDATHTPQSTGKWNGHSTISKDEADCYTPECITPLYAHPAAPVAQGDAPTDSGPISRQWLTVVYRGVEAGDEVQQICTHPKVSAMSWSHALHDRDVARSQAKEGA